MANTVKPKWYWRVLRWTAKWALILVIFAVAVGVIYQWTGTKLSERKYPAPGQLYDIGGYRLHLNCTGQGEPVVILDAGLGGGALDWSTVQPSLSKSTKVCSFDHAGLGWSDPGPHPRDGERKVQELHKLLSVAGVKPPFILAGHSLGGLTSQLYASEFPDEVAGVVLVDSSHELQGTKKELTNLPAWALKSIRLLTPIGGARLLLNMTSKGLHIPEEFADIRLSVYSRTSHLKTTVDEAEAIDQLMAQVHAKPMQLGQKPLIVLTHGKVTRVPMMSEERVAAGEKAWQELQAELATRSSNSQQIIAANSTHFIQVDEPNVVIDAIKSVVDKVRGQSAPNR